MLAISYPEAVQKKRPNYYIKRIKCTTMLASKKNGKPIHTAHLESSSQEGREGLFKSTVRPESLRVATNCSAAFATDGVLWYS